MKSHISHLQQFYFVALCLLASDAALAGPIKDGICAAVSVTESILPAVISLATVGGSAVALYMKAGGEWMQTAMKGVLGAGLLASAGTIGLNVAGGKAQALFNCTSSGAMQSIINNL